MFEGLKSLSGAPEAEKKAVGKHPEQQPRKGGMPVGMQILTDSTFARTVNRYPAVVIDFWAPWCGPCRMVSPIIADLSKDYTGKAVFGKLNTAQNRAVPTQLKIRSIPTILIYSHGKQADKIVGVVPKAVIESRIKKRLMDARN